ncbi:MAG: hypothetical protein IKK63_01160 [Clostridia bacterium]|nr:hypothetical protein [Clostridia bacterium]
MKKAKRLLAVLMAFVMILSASCINVYAYTQANDYYNPSVSRNKYYLSYEQGCGWLLDMLDDMLSEGNMVIHLGWLDDQIGGAGVVWNLTSLDDNLKNAGNPGDKGSVQIQLNSVDGVIRTLYALVYTLQNDTTLKFASGLVGIFSNLFGDLLDALNLEGLDLNKQRQFASDSEVLGMVLSWLGHQTDVLAGLVAGTFDIGTLVGDMLADVITDSLGYTGADPLKNLDYVIQTLLYSMLIDSDVTQVSGTMLDDGVQDLINWALIEGTGDEFSESGRSILGTNFEPLMGEALASQPGGASITAVDIMADHDLDGVPEAHTMSTYQLVNNAIRALLDGMVVPLLTDVLCDALDVEITEDQPYGDPEILNDQMFSMIVGLVESLLVQNGAPEPKYTEDENTYPLLKIQALLNWLFNEGGLDTFLLIDYQGIHLQDNFMSLLNDLIRLLVNMLPSLGLFQDSAYLGYEGDELTAIWYYADTNPKTLVAEGDETAVDQTYIPYEDSNAILYATQYEEVDGVTVATAYNYVSNDMPVNISDETAANYYNPDFIRPNYVVPTDKVYATVIKMALNEFIEGCYFPEWADDIPTALAYAMAGLASQALPQNNFYERLDAYHKLEQAGGVGIVVDGNNNEISPIPYTAVKRISIKNIHGSVIRTEDVVVPKGAIDIGCSYLAAYLNNVLMLNKSMILSTDTTFEKFLTQFITWALDQYMPAMVGVDGGNGRPGDGDGVYGESGEYPGVWTTAFNTLLSAVYSDVATLTFRDDVEAYTAEGVLRIDAIYDFLDKTLFSLIPTSWLPDINGSSQMINSWLLGNLIEFDLIGILNLLTVNMDYENGELNKPLLTVLLRVIDRVLALVFNGESVLLPVRENVLSGTYSPTSITTLSGLLSSRVKNENGDLVASTSASLPMFIKRLITLLVKYRYEILSTALPLLAGLDYVREYDPTYIGSNKAALTIDQFDRYINSLTKNINATKIIEGMEDRELAEAIVNGEFSIKRNSEGTAYDLIITRNESIYGSYATKAEADAVVASFKNTYLEEVLVSEATEEAEAVYNYNIWREWDYLEAATRTDTTDDKGAVSKFTDFKFSTITPRGNGMPYVAYEKDQFQYLNYEDLGAAGYFYTGTGDAIDEAESFLDSYKSFIENDLSDASHEWFMYSVRAQLRNQGKYDSNDDGKVLTADTTEGDVTYYADGDPGIPEAMYPFYTTSATSYQYPVQVHGAGIPRTATGWNNEWDNGVIYDMNTISMADINETNYEQLRLALELAADDKNDIRFSREEIEDIVTLASGVTNFDITPDGVDENGNYIYHPNTVRWDTIGQEALDNVVAFCNTHGLSWGIMEEIPYDLTVDYWIARPRFMYMSSSTALISNSSPTPMSYTTHRDNYRTKTIQDMDAISYAEEVNIQVYKGYVEYLRALNKNRDDLYDYFDQISYRYEEAEKNRSKAIDITMLEWATNTFKDAYEGNAGRNLKYDGVDANNQLKTTRMYTTTSYEKFRIAYDYALSLIDAKANNLLGSDELTQSMASEAFYGIIKAFYALVPYMSDADWTQLDAYIDLAETIISDPLSYDEFNGYNMEDGQWDIMEIVLNDSKNLRLESLDGERQSEIDDMASALYQAIYKLNYLTSPDLISNVNDAGEKLVGTVVTNVGSSRITGQVFGLEEGVGAIMDLVQVIGMREDAGAGTTVTITGSGRGVGTGAYFVGTVENRERFRYYAVVYGDINGDSRVDGTDASALEIAAMTSDGTITQADLGSAAKFEAADANHDGNVDGLDVEAIVTHYTFESEIDQKAHSTAVVVE